jgi:hypothetical protein
MITKKRTQFRFTNPPPTLKVLPVLPQGHARIPVFLKKKKNVLLNCLLKIPPGHNIWSAILAFKKKILSERIQERWSDNNQD